MKSSQVLAEIRDLNIEWRRQDFQFTSQQQNRYNELLALRRQRVKELQGK